MKYSIILPCRNEEKTIGACIKKIKWIMDSIGEKDYEIIVSDSSSDNSSNIARSLGAKIVKHEQGYGNAYLEGFKVAKGDILILGDSDDTYDFLEIPRLIKYVPEYDLVLGKRKYIHEGAMSLLHRYIGNPVLSFTLRLFFNAKIKDVHTGFRVIKREKLEKLNLRTTGMEFASEMIIKAIKNKLKIKEVPIHYHKRKGKSKLRSFGDGWRHLRFMLLYSPLYLFLIPGLTVFFLGLILTSLLYYGLFDMFSLKFGYHMMFVTSLLIILGYQLIFFSVFAKTYSVTNLGEKSSTIDFINKFLTIERAIFIGLLIILSGIVIGGFIIIKWINSGFGDLQEIKNAIITLTLIVLGIQTIFSSFMLSTLGIKEK